MAKRGQNMEFAREVAKKKPILKDAIDNMDQYTVAEINTMSIPGWTKRVIIAEKELNEKRKGCISPEEIAQLMIEKSQNLKE
jgi:ribosomal protein L23